MIVLAAGGTGGHFFPAQALAEKLLEQDQRVVFITDRRTRKFGGKLAHVPLYCLSIRRGKKPIFILSLIWAFFEALGILIKLKPQKIVGFGGYPAFPTLVAGIVLRIPIILHEQNAILGRTNKILAPFVKKIATSFKIFEDNPKFVFTGNPVRAEIKALSKMPYHPLIKNEPIQILVTGGSQGTKVFSEILPHVFAKLNMPLQIYQQCRPEDLEEVKALYEGYGLKAQCQTFFDTMPELLKSSHLIICRSGASSLTEIAVAGRPALFVPYPHAMDDHQTANAKMLFDAGGCEVMAQSGFTVEAIIAKLMPLFEHPDLLSSYALNARNWAEVNAADRLANLVMEN